MSEEELSLHSQEEIRGLRERGVQIQDVNSIHVGREVQLENISPGCTIYPFVRIIGPETQIHSGAQIGVRGSVTLENSWIGENAVVGSLGPVTLKDTVVGPKSVLGSGVAEQAVFLGKETMVNDFTTGYGFRIRKGSLYEEDSSSAQHTDTKMTVLFPWNTLGSNINFCDALIAGGTGPELGNFSEVGSGSIHFNYSIRGDKATASLFGDVYQGVFLDQERLFIGGNNTLLGPIKADFGVMTAAGARIKGTLSPGLNFGHSTPKGKIDYDSRRFSGALGIVTKQIDFLAELTALFHWYQQVRIGCISQTTEQKFVYESGLNIVELNYKERLFQLSRYVEALEGSLSIFSGSNKMSKKETAEQRQLLEKWPKIQQQLATPKAFELLIPESLTNAIARKLAEGKLDYTVIIKGMDIEGKQKGKDWLNTIANGVRNIINSEIAMDG